MGLRGGMSRTPAVSSFPGAHSYFETRMRLPSPTAGQIIRRIWANRTMTTAAGLFRISSTPPFFYGPSGLASDGAGGVYIADRRNSLIRWLRANGDVQVVAGNTSSGLPVDGVAVNGRLNLPLGVAVDSAGAIYIADSGNNALRLVTASGIMSTLIGASGVSGYTGDFGGRIVCNFGW